MYDESEGTKSRYMNIQERTVRIAKWTSGFMNISAKTGKIIYVRNIVSHFTIFLLYFSLSFFLVCWRKIYIHNAFMSCIIFDPFLFITSMATAWNITHTQSETVKTENAIVDTRAQRIYNDIGISE